LKELEIKERKIELEKLKELEEKEELELATATEATEKFDVTRHVRFVPPFQETKPDKYFLYFEKIVTSIGLQKFGLCCCRVH